MINVLHIRDSKGLYGAEQVILNIGKNIDKKSFCLKLLCFTGNDDTGKQLIEGSRAEDKGGRGIPLG